MQIAIIGAGNVGAALGQGWSRAGHTIRYGVSDPTDNKHRSAADRSKGAQVSLVSDAVTDADIIVLAVPWDAVEAAMNSCGLIRARRG